MITQFSVFILFSIFFFLILKIYAIYIYILFKNQIHFQHCYYLDLQFEGLFRVTGSHIQITNLRMEVENGTTSSVIANQIYFSQNEQEILMLLISAYHHKL